MGDGRPRDEDLYFELIGVRGMGHRLRMPRVKTLP
jgi:hypothetical protein